MIGRETCRQLTAGCPTASISSRERHRDRTVDCVALTTRFAPLANQCATGAEQASRRTGDAHLRARGHRLGRAQARVKVWRASELEEPRFSKLLLREHRLPFVLNPGMSREVRLRMRSDHERA